MPESDISDETLATYFLTRLQRARADVDSMRDQLRNLDLKFKEQLRENSALRTQKEDPERLQEMKNRIASLEEKLRKSEMEREKISKLYNKVRAVIIETQDTSADESA